MTLYEKSDFDEEILKTLIRSPEAFNKAKELKMVSDDFLTSFVTGVQFYKEVAAAIFTLDSSPISRNLLTASLEPYFEVTTVPNDRKEQFLDWVYSDELSIDFIIHNLPEFIKFRRLSKAQEVHKQDPDKLLNEMSKIAGALSKVANKKKVKSASPFDTISIGTHSEGILTGFTKIDHKLYGLGRQECGLLIGHSGSGKTAVASNIARYAAIAGYRVLYISLEEPQQNIINRWYARQFEMSYTQLHYGANPDATSSGSNIKAELESALRDMDQVTRDTLRNLHIIDGRELTPINANVIVGLIEEKYQEEGFIPDLVIIDQLDYVEPITQLPKNSSPWQAYEKCAFELDTVLSQHKVDGKDENTFGLWVVHQGKGGMKWEFGYDDIAGFKGIVKPFDAAIGVGRHSKDLPYVNLFSMKVRHTEHVRQSYYADFKTMSFFEKAWSPDMEKNTSKASKGLEEKKEAPKKKFEA